MGLGQLIAFSHVVVAAHGTGDLRSQRFYVLHVFERIDTRREYKDFVCFEFYF